MRGLIVKQMRLLRCCCCRSLFRFHSIFALHLPLFLHPEWRPLASSSLSASMTRCSSVLWPGKLMWPSAILQPPQPPSNLFPLFVLFVLSLPHVSFLSVHSSASSFSGIQRSSLTTSTSSWSVQSWCHASCILLRARLATINYFIKCFEGLNMEAKFWKLNSIWSVPYWAGNNMPFFFLCDFNDFIWMFSFNSLNGLLLHSDTYTDTLDSVYIYCMWGTNI